VQSKKIRTNFESQDVTRLLDARRLQVHHFTDKAIDSPETKKQFVAESFNQGFFALPKGDYGVALQENEIVVSPGRTPARRDRGETCTPCAARATWPPEVPARGSR
jgi:hypothetical protein